MSTARDKMLAAITAFRPVPVAVPGVDAPLFVRPLTVGGMARMTKNPANGGSAMIAECLVDEAGARVFGSADDAAIADMPRQMAEAIIAAINKASGIADDAGDAGDAPGK